MKLQATCSIGVEGCRSREGAWIEIVVSASKNSGQSVAPVRERGLKLLSKPRMCLTLSVAPVRERGLKYVKLLADSNYLGRSREGAWIEIAWATHTVQKAAGRSREGAWIEMNSKQWFQSRQRRRRSREGAWIEITLLACVFL